MNTFRFKRPVDKSPRTPIDERRSARWVVAISVLLGSALAGCSTGTLGDRGPRQGQGEGTPELAGGEAPAGAIWLDTLDLSLVEQEWGRAQAGKSVDGKPLTLHGQVYEHGIGTHAFSELVVNLKGTARSFRADAGVDDEAGDYGSVVFVVLVDGQEAARTGVLQGGDPPERLEVNLAGAQRMTLLVENAGDGIHCDHADWGGALLVLEPGAVERPETYEFPPGPPPQIAVERSLRPAIHAPRITGATPGRPFLFRIPATGEGPLRFAASNLPAGLELDAESGIITGSLTSEGTTEVKITVTGPQGEATESLTIVGGQHSLALTPPMGWNSWNVWGTSVDDAKVRSAADWMVASGLAAHGYQYINIDDAWEADRDDKGRIQSNDKFPDMKALADYVHSKGLKLGIYSSPGPTTCAGYLGSYEHEQLDADRYAEWGIDLIKYDWCSYKDIAPDLSEPELRRPYEVMRQALDNCGRDIVFSICQYGMGNVSQWGAAVGGNYWRTTGDITDTWPSMSGIGFGQDGLEEFAGPGHWNDPDMLVVGQLGWGPDLHPTRLTPNEQLTHITLWSLLASPLLIGCDLSQLDEFTLALLTNPEVLEVNQDPLGRQAGRVWERERLEVWSRTLDDGSLAVGLFNRRRTQETINVTWEDLGISGPHLARNLWTRQDEGVYLLGYSGIVAPHGAVMLKISAAD